MDGRLTLGDARIADGAENGFRDVGGGNGLWCAIDSAGSFCPARGRSRCLKPSTTIAGRGRQPGSGTRCVAWNAEVSGRQEVGRGRDRVCAQRRFAWTFTNAILQRKEKFFVIQCGERQESVSVDRLKAANADPDSTMQPAVPPKRGHPPKKQQGASEFARDHAKTGVESGARSDRRETSPPTLSPTLSSSAPSPASYAQVRPSG